MKPTSFIDIQIDGPRVEDAHEATEPIDKGGPAAGGYTVRLGWIEGAPYLIDLGSAGQVLVNDAPIEPYIPVVIQEGDRITIGNARFAWHAGMEAGSPDQAFAEPEVSRETVRLPRIADGEPEAGGPAEAEDVAQAEAADATLPAREPVVEEVSPEVPDPTLLVRKPVVEEVSPEVPDPTLLVRKPVVEEVPPEVPDPALLVPKPITEPDELEPPDPTLLVPRKMAQPPRPGVSDAEVAAREELPEEPQDTTTYMTAWVDMAQIVEQDADLEFVSTTILRDTRIPHLVVHLPDRTWEVQLTGDSLTLGRGRRNDVRITDESVSQHHALIERRGDGFRIRDVDSRNGLWLGKQRIEEHMLSDGDVLSIGRAKLVFNGGFTPDDLTLLKAPRIDGKPQRRPVVFVPGMMGSELWIGGERLWPNPKLIISNVEIFALPGDPRIEARGILNEVVIVPNLIQLRQYSGLGDYLVSGLGYTRGEDLLEFGYDWRYDVRLAAQRLAEAIEAWQVQAPITIIAHSLGTLVARYYVERLGGKRRAERIILMGGPHHGTPQGLAAILTGPGILPFGMGAERMRSVLATFPSAFQILPAYDCAVDQDGNAINLLKDDWWLPQNQRHLLRAARSFRRELGTASSVPAVSVFGYGLKTKLRVKLHQRAGGLWDSVEFFEDSAGDQSVPSGSAVLPDSEIHPVFQEHGSLYVDDSVRMRLKVELTRSTTWQGRK